MRWSIVILAGLAFLLVATTPAAADGHVCETETNEFRVGNVTVTTCGEAHFDRRDVIAHAGNGEDWIHVNPNMTELGGWSNRWLLHELGHTLGYNHVDGGVMDYSMPDGEPEPCDLSPVTRDIAAASPGFEPYALDRAGIQSLANAYGDGDVALEPMRWAIDRWAAGDDCDVVLYTDNFDGFGGYYDDRRMALGQPVYQRAGYFYGHPSLTARYN